MFLSRNSGGTTFFTTSSITASLSVPCATSSVCCVETTTVVARTALPSLYSTVTWHLPSGRRNGSCPLARVAEPLADPVRRVDRERHVLLRLVARVAEHHPLVAGALLLEQALALGDALGDVGRLPLDRGDDGAGIAVEAALRGGVADVADHAPCAISPKCTLALRRDLAGDHHEARLDQRLARDAAVGILGEHRVQDGVGDLVADLVGMAFVDRFRSEHVVLQHRAADIAVARVRPRQARGLRPMRACYSASG